MDINTTTNRKSIELIWTLTHLCHKKCRFCCVDAQYIDENCTDYHSFKEFNYNLRIGKNTNPGNIFVPKTNELSFNEKIRVIDNISLTNEKIRIDFSGGDPFIIPENLKLIKYATDIFGKKAISVSTTLNSLYKIEINELSYSIAEIGLSISDFIGDGDPSEELLRMFDTFYKTRVKVKVHIPLTRRFLNRTYCLKIFKKLHQLKIDEILLMRLFPVGRIYTRQFNMLTRNEHLEIMDNFFHLETEYCLPKIIIQCALQGIYSNGKENSCKMGCNSFGVTADGLLILSAWGYGKNGKPLGSDWIIGDLKTTVIDDLLKNNKVMQFEKEGIMNNGHCKVYCWIYGGKSWYSFFNAYDPLLNDIARKH